MKPVRGRAEILTLVLKSMSFLLHHAGSLTECSNLLHIHQGLAPLGVSTQNTYNYDDIQPPFSFHPSSDLGWSWWTSRGLGSEFSAAQPAVLSLGLGWRSELQLHPHAAEAPQWTVNWGPRSDSCPVSLLTHRWSPIKTTSHEHTLWNFQGEGSEEGESLVCASLLPLNGNQICEKNGCEKNGATADQGEGTGLLLLL